MPYKLVLSICAPPTPPTNAYDTELLEDLIANHTFLDTSDLDAITWVVESLMNPRLVIILSPPTTPVDATSTPGGGMYWIPSVHMGSHSSVALVLHGFSNPETHPTVLLDYHPGSNYTFEWQTIFGSCLPLHLLLTTTDTPPWNTWIRMDNFALPEWWFLPLVSK